MRQFDFAYYHTLSPELQRRLLKICISGVENPDEAIMGCYAFHPEDYDLFKPFFKRVLADYHKVSQDAKHVNNWSLDGAEGLPSDRILDLSRLGFKNNFSMRVRTGRNLADFPLPGAMTMSDRINLEKKMCEAFEKLISMREYGGRYYSLTPGTKYSITDEEYQKLVNEHLMFKDMSEDPCLRSAGISGHWPYGRGCYISGDRQFIIWVGEEDHLRIMCMKKGMILNEVFDRLKGSLDVINGIEGLKFAISSNYGVITSCPTNLGTAMRASVHIGLPNLCADGTDKKAKEICRPLGLSVRGLGGEDTPIGPGGVCDISPSARFCITEGTIIAKLYNGIRLLKEQEENHK